MAAAAGTGLMVIPLVALLLLAAHFVHAGLWPVAAACVAATSLLWIARPWAARTLQVLLAFGTLEWILTAATRAEMRVAHGEPYVRLLVILGVVAVFTAFAALVIQHPALAQRFGRGGARNGSQPGHG